MVRRLDKYGSFDKNSEVVQLLTSRLKELEEAGFEYEAAEASFDLLVKQTMGLYRAAFERLSYHVNVETDAVLHVTRFSDAASSSTLRYNDYALHTSLRHRNTAAKNRKRPLGE